MCAAEDHVAPKMGDSVHITQDVHDDADAARKSVRFCIDQRRRECNVRVRAEDRSKNRLKTIQITNV